VGGNVVGDFVFATAMYDSGDWESAPSLPANLIDSVARYTSLPVSPKGVNVGLGTEELFRYPFIWLTGHLPVRFTDQERLNVKRYVERGGFMVVDDHNHDIDGIFSKTALEEITRTFGKPIDLPNDDVESLIGQIFRLTTPLAGKDFYQTNPNLLVLHRCLLRVRIEPLQQEAERLRC